MDEGLQYIRKNALKGCKCRMDEPFMFISYSHDDKEIVQDWFLKLYRLGYNLWIDVANLPHNQQSWEDAAEDALLSGNCVRLLFFRSENSMKSVNIYEELNKAIKSVGKGYTLQRYKGLGEMNPEQLWETTMNPANRSLIRVGIEDAADVEHLVTLLMGDKVAPRKEYISEHADFNRDDSFASRVSVDDMLLVAR